MKKPQKKVRSRRSRIVRKGPGRPVGRRNVKVAYEVDPFTELRRALNDLFSSKKKRKWV